MKFERWTIKYIWVAIPNQIQNESSLCLHFDITIPINHGTFMQQWSILQRKLTNYIYLTQVNFRWQIGWTWVKFLCKRCLWWLFFIVSWQKAKEIPFDFPTLQWQLQYQSRCMICYQRFDLEGVNYFGGRSIASRIMLFLLCFGNHSCTGAMEFKHH